MPLTGPLGRIVAPIVRPWVILLLVAGGSWSQISIGGFGGISSSIGKATSYYSEPAKLERSYLYGVDCAYRLHNGIFVGIGAERLQMNLTYWDYSGKYTLGALNLQPLLLTGGYQGRPKNGRGISAHARVGAGIASATFNKSAEILELERQLGPTHPTAVLRTRKAPLVELGAGIDFFIHRHVSLTTDFRALLAKVRADYSTVCTGQCVILGSPDLPRTLVPALGYIDGFSASTGQVLGGVRFWLW